MPAEYEPMKLIEMFSVRCFRCGKDISYSKDEPLDENLIYEKADGSCLFFCSLECKIIWIVKAEVLGEIESREIRKRLKPE